MASRCQIGKLNKASVQLVARPDVTSGRSWVRTTNQSITEGGSVYILQSQTSGLYYISSSRNPDKRLVEHNIGKTTATRNKGPWEIKLTQFYVTAQEARRIEYKLKKLKRRDIIEKIIKDQFIKMR